ncbi:MAG: hypothetical protein V2A56_09360 [bacterium]
MSGGDETTRIQALRLNLLILLGYRNAVSVDTSLPLRIILEIASDSEQTDGVRYDAEEVKKAISGLLEDETIRQVKEDFDSTNLAAYATGFHPDHRFYITPVGILSVKRLLDSTKGEALQIGEEE